jgi:predicted transcriptional regulator
MNKAVTPTKRETQNGNRPTEMKGRRKSRIEAWGNMVKARELRDEGLTLQQIADILACTHTTIIYYLRKYDDYSQYDKEFQEFREMQKDSPAPITKSRIVSANRVVEVCKKELGTGYQFLRIMNQLGITL